MDDASMHSRMPGLPVAPGAIRDAFTLPDGILVDSFHAGSSGAWRLRAPTGESWSVKALPVDAPGYQIETLRTAGELERHALGAGVAIVPPLLPRDPAVALATRIDTHLVWLHCWVDPRPEPDRAATHAWIGETAARLHALWPTGSDRDAGLPYGLHPVDDWRGWFAEAATVRLPWAGLGAAALPAIAEASSLARAALAIPGLPRCISHRDLNSPNVLHGPDGPLLCDFGFSGIEVPWFEIVDAALSFGQTGSETIDAYLRAGGQRGPETSEALAHTFGGALNFLAFSMWVSLGHRRVRPDQRDDATDRIPGLVETLTEHLESLETNRARLFGR
jgi:hypothetical protein